MLPERENNSEGPLGRLACGDYCGERFEAGRTYFGLRTNSQFYDDLSHVRMGVYLLCVTYWIMMLWRDAPPGREMTERMRRQLAAINAGAALDLQELRSRRVP